MAEVKRSVRVGHAMGQELSSLLIGEVKDPRLAGVLVSRVQVTDDLRSARVYVRLLQGGTPAQVQEALKGLERAAGHLRQQVGKRLQLRFTPELRFFYDEERENIDRMEQLLDEVRRESRSA